MTYVYRNYDSYSLHEATIWMAYVGTYVTCGRSHPNTLNTAIYEVRMLR